MAQYGDIIGDLSLGSLGSTPPAGFTRRWGTLNIAYAVEEDAQAPNGKRLNVQTSGTARRLDAYDAVNSDSDRGTADVLMLVRANVALTGSNGAFIGPFLRGSGATATETGILGGIRRSSSPTLTNLPYSSGTSDPSLFTGMAVAQGDTFWLRITASGSTSTATGYEDNNGTLGDQIAEVVDNSAPAANSDNWIGIFTFQNGANFDILWMSIGTGSDSAPLPSAVPTPVSFDGTVPTLEGAEGQPFSESVASYFSGTETPFTYSLQAGTLPDGLSLNSSTGVISGTPTTEGTATGIVIRATDQESDTADTNAFSIEISAVAPTDYVLRNDLPFRDDATTLTNDEGVNVIVLTDDAPPTVAGEFTADIVDGYITIEDEAFETENDTYKLVVEKDTYSRTAAATVVID